MSITLMIVNPTPEMTSIVREMAEGHPETVVTEMNTTKSHASMAVVHAHLEKELSAGLRKMIYGGKADTPEYKKMREDYNNMVELTAQYMDAAVKDIIAAGPALCEDTESTKVEAHKAEETEVETVKAADGKEFELKTPRSEYLDPLEGNPQPDFIFYTKPLDLAYHDGFASIVYTHVISSLRYLYSTCKELRHMRATVKAGIITADYTPNFDTRCTFGFPSDYYDAYRSVCAKVEDTFQRTFDGFSEGMVQYLRKFGVTGAHVCIDFNSIAREEKNSDYDEPHENHIEYYMPGANTCYHESLMAICDSAHIHDQLNAIAAKYSIGKDLYATVNVIAVPCIDESQKRGAAYVHAPAEIDDSDFIIDADVTLNSMRAGIEHDLECIFDHSIDLTLIVKYAYRKTEHVRRPILFEHNVTIDAAAVSNESYRQVTKVLEQYIYSAAKRFQITDRASYDKFMKVKATVVTEDKYPIDSNIVLMNVYTGARSTSLQRTALMDAFDEYHAYVTDLIRHIAPGVSHIIVDVEFGNGVDDTCHDIDGYKDPNHHDVDLSVHMRASSGTKARSAMEGIMIQYDQISDELFREFPGLKKYTPVIDVFIDCEGEKPILNDCGYMVDVPFEFDYPDAYARISNIFSKFYEMSFVSVNSRGLKATQIAMTVWFKYPDSDETPCVVEDSDWMILRRSMISATYSMDESLAQYEGVLQEEASEYLSHAALQFQRRCDDNDIILMADVHLVDTFDWDDEDTYTLKLMASDAVSNRAKIEELLDITFMEFFDTLQQRLSLMIPGAAAAIIEIRACYDRNDTFSDDNTDDHESDDPDDSLDLADQCEYEAPCFDVSDPYIKCGNCTGCKCVNRERHIEFVDKIMEIPRLANCEDYYSPNTCAETCTNYDQCPYNKIRTTEMTQYPDRFNFNVSMEPSAEVSEDGEMFISLLTDIRKNANLMVEQLHDALAVLSDCSHQVGREAGFEPAMLRNHLVHAIAMLNLLHTKSFCLDDGETMEESDD